MPGGDINIDLGSTLPYLEDKLLSLLGKDRATKEFKNNISKHLKRSLNKASYIQCIGMSKPVPIDKIYQKTRLKSNYYKQGKDEELDVFDLTDKKINAVIKGRPGSGKTVLLQWVYIKLLNSNMSPFLFTLRDDDEFKLFCKFVEKLVSEYGEKENNKSDLFFLLDGYDELSLNKRTKLSKYVNDFKALNIGSYLLTCRSFYEVYNLKTPIYHVTEFKDKDAKKFIESFFEQYEEEIASYELISELDKRGFSDFFYNPLMLTLVCVVKVGPLPDLPQSTIGLIERALNTLTFRWDEQKYVHREGIDKIDGTDRIKLLKHLAFHSGISTSDYRIDSYVQDFLKLHQNENISPRKLLREIAKFYGVYIPVNQNRWTFIHRTIFDFLYAKYWVETGKFANSTITEYDEKVAYAACMIPDATRILRTSLIKSSDLTVLIECLLNNAHFNSHKIAKSILNHFRNRNCYEIEFAENLWKLNTNKKFIEYANNKLLKNLMKVSLKEDSESGKFMYLYAAAELVQRNDNRKLNENMYQPKIFPKEFVIGEVNSNEGEKIGHKNQLKMSYQTIKTRCIYFDK